MTTFNDLNSEEEREYAEQGLAHFSALKSAILDASLVESEALADGDNEVVAQVAADRRKARKVDAAGSVPTPDSVIADIAAQRALAEPDR